MPFTNQNQPRKAASGPFIYLTNDAIKIRDSWYFRVENNRICRQFFSNSGQKNWGGGGAREGEGKFENTIKWFYLKVP